MIQRWFWLTHLCRWDSPTDCWWHLRNLFELIKGVINFVFFLSFLMIRSCFNKEDGKKFTYLALSDFVNFLYSFWWFLLIYAIITNLFRFYFYFFYLIMTKNLIWQLSCTKFSLLWFYAVIQLKRKDERPFRCFIQVFLVCFCLFWFVVLSRVQLITCTFDYASGTRARVG